MSDHVEGYRLSPQQEHLWNLQREGEAFHAGSAIRIEGDLDPDRLRRALESLVARHEILRTTFQRTPGVKKALQVIGAAGRLAWESGGAAADGENGQASRRFDFANGPLLAARLVPHGGTEHTLRLDLPALCADQKTLANLFTGLVDAYAALEAGAGGNEDGETVQYLQFSEWQHEMLAEAGEAREERTGAMRLPLGRGRGGEGERGAAVRLAVEPGLAGRVEAVAARYGVSPEAFYLACWKLLLARLGGAAEAAVHAVVGGRSYEELEDACGLFAKALPVTVRLADEMPFHRLLATVGRALGRAREEQDSHRPAVRPLQEDELRVGFELVDLPSRRSAGGLSFTVLEQAARIERFDLELRCARSERGVAAVLEYDAPRFERRDIEALAGRWRALVERLAAEPQTTVGAVHALTADEHRRLLVEWNATAAEYPSELCLHQLLARQAARTPAAPALISPAISPAGQWTFAELDARANALAHHLRALGVGPEDLVGVCVERSPEMVVAVLGILKAGAAFVPLDPGYPEERLACILEQSGTRLVLTREPLLHRLPARAGQVVLLDRLELAAGAEAPPDAGAEPRNLAYALFTSGSTGRPKGVMIPHRGLVNYLVWAAGYYAAAEGAGSPVHSPLGFDLTLTSLFCPLLAGRPVHLMPEDGAVDGLIEALRARRHLSLVKLTPAHLEILNEALGTAAPAGRANVLVIGGEALRAEAVAPWRGQETRLVNEYGPTETVVGCCVHEVGPGSPRSGVLPIGRPIANMRLYVLDAGFRPVPAGVPGEIFIAGDGLARGYLGRPDLTAERFVPDPFSAQPGGRLYRTGDLGRHLPQADLELEFLGRADAQVKIRGFRVEPGEVEALLLEHPGVREAAVVAREDSPAGPRLVAYYVPQPERRLDPAEVRELLARRLPEYMMPAALLPLAALPLTVHGKVDRGALPAPEQVRRDGAVFTPPRTQTEILLADLWRQLLGVERVGAGDDFFQLGGHSLVAMQLVSRLRGVFGVELTVDQFFETSRLGALAAAIDAALNGGPAASVTAATAAPPIRRADRAGLLPLSFSQERIWLLDRLEPGSPAYNVPAAFLLRGRLDVPAMERGMSEVVRRHEVLRTVFAQVDGRPVQVIQAPSPWSLPVVDLTALAGAVRDAEVQRLSTAEARRPFDLAAGPVLRTALLRLDDAAQVLLATMHHAVSDGWSMELLLGEQAALYNAFLAGEPSPLPELPIQYADYAAWQRGWLDGEVLERQVGYWKRRLGDAPAVLALPADRPRPAVQRYRGASRAHLLPAALRDALQGRGRAERTTLFMTLLGAFQVLLSRYSGETDLSVGSPVAGRSREEVEGLIGFFTNTLLLRADLGGDPAFTEHLARVRRATLEAFAHQDVPFEKLVEELKPERDRSRPPLFQVAFTLQESPASALAAGAGLTGLEVTVLPLENGTSKLDLHLDLRALEEGIGATLQFNTDLFDAATADRLLRHFEVLAASLAENPERRLSALRLLTDEERHQLLVDWSEARPAAADDLFPRLFEARAAERPDAVAVAFDGRQVTYGELNARANRLARHLLGFGVGPEVLVGLCVERSPEMVLALLGILKAGAAYLPLDPSYPLERLAFMLEDAQAPVLVTQESLAGMLPSHWAFTIDLGASWDAFAGESGDDLSDLDGAPLSDGPAYVIYTSGSTGRSKGVVVRHQGLANLALGMARSLGVGPESRFLQFSSLSFDASVAEATPALAAGAALHLASRQDMMPGIGMVRRLQELEVTHAILPPSVLAALPAEPLPALATLTVAGEACPAELAAAWSVGRRFVDAYGPTEITVCASLADYAGTGKPTIGHPFPGLRTHVLDRHLQPVPAGVPGELFVGGVGVARGYLNRPELTAARFVPDPFAGTPGGRLYRTGDLVRWLADGALDFLGRIDHQVKVRGFRIEPGEIEAVLGDHPAVRETVVVVREDLPGDRRLTAYLVVEPECEPAVEEMRGFVTERLPEFMVPADFVLLAAMPLSPNGKVDRAALPAPDRARRAAGDAFVAPRDPVEELLAQVWAETLGVERVGVHDDFFELGGHSLAATQVLDRVRHLLGVEVSMGAFFGQPTVAGVAGLALAVDAEKGRPGDPILPVPRDGDLPLSFAQELMWAAERRGDAAWLHNVPMAYWVRGPLEIAALAGSLDEVARRHEVLRTAFPVVNGLPVQRVQGLEDGRLPVVDLQALGRGRGRAEARRLAEQEARRPFDLERGPVWRSLLLRLDELEHLLSLTFHHIVIDPPSGEILQRELAALYTAFTAERPSLSAALSGLGIQYGDYAVWQRRSLDGEALAGQLAYWRERLAGARAVELPRAVELSIPRVRPAGRVARSASHLLRLGPPATAACHRLARRLGCTLSMTALAAFKGLLAGLSGQRDILVRTPVANRRRPEVEPLIGFFPNALLLRTDLAGDPRFAELAVRVRETVLGAYAHQDVPYDVVTGALLPELGLPGDLARVTFNFYGTSSTAPALGGLELEPVEIEPGLTDSDLVLVLQEGADGLACRFSYRQDLFAAAAVRDLAEGLRLLLERAAADPEERLSRLAPETVETGRIGR